MKKLLLLTLAAVVTATTSFASYIVVLKDGTKYEATAKWTVVKGKAIVLLPNGQSLQLDPALIDVARSEQMTKIGMANANIVDLSPNMPEGQAQQQKQQSLGNTIKLRKLSQQPATPAAPTTSEVPAPSMGTGTMPPEVVSKFELAFDNVGIFEKHIKATSAHSIRAELTVDTEERVFNAISATSFLIVRNAGVSNAQIDVVDLFMKTTNGGSAGRFQMTRADADALDKRTMSQQDYFVRKVLY